VAIFYLVTVIISLIVQFLYLKFLYDKYFVRVSDIIIFTGICFVPLGNLVVTLFNVTFLSWEYKPFHELYEKVSKIMNYIVFDKRNK
jgi:hypothetical protein